jgi:hypothetical protein
MQVVRVQIFFVAIAFVNTPHVIQHRDWPWQGLFLKQLKRCVMLSVGSLTEISHVCSTISLVWQFWFTSYAENTCRMFMSVMVTHDLVHYLMMMNSQRYFIYSCTAVGEVQEWGISELWIPHARTLYFLENTILQQGHGTPSYCGNFSDSLVRRVVWIDVQALCNCYSRWAEVNWTEPDIKILFHISYLSIKRWGCLNTIVFICEMYMQFKVTLISKPEGQHFNCCLEII